MALQMHTAQCEMLLFHSKTIIGVELAHLNKEKKEKHSGHSPTFWVSAFHATRSLTSHENPQRLKVCLSQKLIKQLFF